MRFNKHEKTNYVEFVEENGVQTSAKVHYIFRDGTESVVEVDVPMGEFISVSFREEENSNRKERHWISTSIDSLDYEGEWFEDKSLSPAEYTERKHEEEKVAEFMATLTEVQRRRLQMKLDDPDISFRDIARVEGVNVSKVYKSFGQIQEKYRKFFEG